MIIVAIVVYSFLSYSMVSSLDNELVGIAASSTSSISDDVVVMGGVDTGKLSGGGAIMMLMSSDGSVLRSPDENISVPCGDPEVAIARTQLGHSDHSVKANDGQMYRVVAVPLMLDGKPYALALARPLGPTENMLLILRGLLVGVSLLTTAAAVWLGFLAGRQVVRPLQKLSTAMTEVAKTGDLRPTNVHSEGEIGELSKSFDSLMESLAASRAQQQNLVADAGHELRTPLTSMRTNMELLVADDKRGMLSKEDRTQILSDVSAQLTELSALVSDLVLLSRNENARVVFQELDFTVVVNGAIRRAQRRATNNVGFDIQLDRDVVVVGDSDSLERAVLNLLDNAVKFSPAGGTVHVLLHGTTLVVRDEGPGVPEADMDHIFDRFFRSDKARNTPGTGLGLAIVKHTVTQHGGRISVANAPDGGAVFTLWLPAAPSEGSANLS
jgi:two-component system sensor histidine kinase MprB